MSVGSYFKSSAGGGMLSIQSSAADLQAFEDFAKLVPKAAAAAQRRAINKTLGWLRTHIARAVKRNELLELIGQCWSIRPDEKGQPVAEPPPPPSAEATKAQLLNQIDEAADNARRLVAGDPLRAVEYERAVGQHAVALQCVAADS
jgi:hypothetical protein